MTQKQNLHYWRLWGEVCASRAWKMHKGRMTPAPPESPDETIVIGIAANLAAAKHRATTPDDLRHASHYYAAGRDIGHAALTQPQIDKLFALWKLFIDPSNLDAALALENPEIGERKRIIHRLRTAAPDTYIDAICHDQFPGYVSPFWEDLPMRDLRALSLTLRARTHNWTRIIIQVPPGSRARKQAIYPPVAADVSPRKLDPVPSLEPATDYPF